MIKQNIFNTKKRGSTCIVLLYFIIFITAMLLIFAPPVINTVHHIKAVNKWDKVMSNLLITIEEKEDYIGTITLEKEQGTLELNELVSVIKLIEKVEYSGISLVDDNGDKGLILKYTDTSSSKVVNAEAESVDKHTVDIKYEIKYEDEIDIEDYKKLTTEVIEDYLSTYTSSDMYITVKQVSDGIFKAKIRPVNK